ncbi:S8 family serine peptidase [Bacteroidota bacterium]
MRKTFLLILTLLISLSVFAQGKYRIYLSDKDGVSFDPYHYFDAKAIERRIQQNIPLADYTDYPLQQVYVDQISQIADSCGFQSRWFNFVCAYASSEEQLVKLATLPFVIGIEKSDRVPLLFTSINVEDEDEEYNEGLMKNQLERFGGSLLINNQLDGHGIRIAIFDGGFPDVNTHPAFERIRNENRIIKTWDFIKDKENVYYGNSHGRMTFACVGGMWKGQKIGLATGADFLLAKTEVNTEPFSEEEHWLAAAEWADQNGVYVINSSLGYGYHRYFTSDMDGKTSLVVKAANMAAKKGIIVVNSAGNEATDDWETIITPADGDSVLAVGGISPGSEYHISFSSYGPTADKRMKPNVSAYGHVVSLSKTGLKEVDGTSFSSPLTAGFVACIWQMDPTMKNMQLFHDIEKSGHLYPYFDYAHGFGVPQASYFLTYEKVSVKPTFEFIEKDEQIIVRVNRDVDNGTWTGDNMHLYYNIQKNDGVLKSYYVVSVRQDEVLVINKSDYTDMDYILNVHFRGYSNKFSL